MVSVRKALNARTRTRSSRLGAARGRADRGQGDRHPAKEATIGVPSRRARPWLDGTNGVRADLAGPDRMYPDTTFPQRVPAERLERIRAGLPPRIVDREARYKELGVPADLRVGLARSRRGRGLSTRCRRPGSSGRARGGPSSFNIQAARKKGLPRDT